MTDLRADVAEQVGDVVLDELVVHDRLPVRVEQPLELVDLLLLVRLRATRTRNGYSSGTVGYSRDNPGVLYGYSRGSILGLQPCCKHTAMPAMRSLWHAVL